MAFRFPKGTNWVDMPEPNNSDSVITLVLPQPIRIPQDGSYLEQYFQSTSRVPGEADEIIWQASLCTFVSFLTRYFLLRPPAQNTHAYDKIECIIAVYIHVIIDDFIPHVLPKIFVHCVNAVVA